MTVPWRTLDLSVVTDFFLCTDAANYDTMIVLSPCGITSRNVLLTPVFVRGVNHTSQFPYCVVAVYLVIYLVMSRILLMKITWR